MFTDTLTLMVSGLTEENEMPQTVREVMTEKPLALQEGTTLQEAARAMRDHDVGDVVLLRDDQVTGIVTDRDIVIRGVAEGLGPDEGVLSQVASKPSMEPETHRLPSGETAHAEIGFSLARNAVTGAPVVVSQRRR